MREAPVLRRRWARCASFGVLCLAPLLLGSGCILYQGTEPPRLELKRYEAPLFAGTWLRSAYSNHSGKGLSHTQAEPIYAAFREEINASGLCGGDAPRTLRVHASVTFEINIPSEVLSVLTGFLSPTFIDNTITVTGQLRAGESVVAKATATATLTEAVQLFFFFLPPLWASPSAQGFFSEPLVQDNLKALTRKVLSDLAAAELRIRAQEAEEQRRQEEERRTREALRLVFLRARKAVVERKLILGKSDEAAIVALLGETWKQARPQGDVLHYASGQGAEAMELVLDLEGRLRQAVEVGVDGRRTDWTPRLGGTAALPAVAPTAVVARPEPAGAAGPTREAAAPRAPEKAAQAAKPPGRGRVFVLTVGIDDYRDPQIPDLRFAENDAHALSAFFLGDRRSPTDPDRVMALQGAKATRRAILQALHDHLGRKATRPDDVAVFYFAGHGFADGSATYLAAYDSELAALEATAVTEGDLQLAWNRIGGRKVFISDACHSGGIAGFRGIGGVVLAPAAAGASPQKPDGGGAVIAASGPNELSVEDARTGHGVFTQALLDGLRGGADADRDQRVSLSELRAYLRREVPARARAVGGKQHPTVRVPASLESLRMTR